MHRQKDDAKAHIYQWAGILQRHTHTALNMRHAQTNAMDEKSWKT